jgi:hypothetical protein
MPRGGNEARRRSASFASAAGSVRPPDSPVSCTLVPSGPVIERGRPPRRALSLGREHRALAASPFAGAGARSLRCLSRGAPIEPGAAVRQAKVPSAQPSVGPNAPEQIEGSRRDLDGNGMLRGGGSGRRGPERGACAAAGSVATSLPRRPDRCAGATCGQRCKPGGRRGPALGRRAVLPDVAFALVGRRTGARRSGAGGGVRRGRARALSGSRSAARRQ